MATPPVKAKHEHTQPPELTNPNQPLVPSDYPPPPFLNSVSDLRTLSTTLSSFLRRYDDLQGHLDYIRTNIHDKLPNHLNTTQFHIPADIPTSKSTPSAQNPNADSPVESELERICEARCGRQLRVYFISHLSEIDKLREEAPKALKKSRDPAKFVLNCLGRFYLQGIKAFTKDSPMITSREASILGLECFLLMGCDGVVIEPSVKEESDSAALAWRNRLLTEGGLSTACEADARGLLLLISCFGIPQAFSNVDVRNLLRSCNLREIAPALLRSTVLKAKIPEVLDGMVKSKLEVDAVDIAYTLQVENFPRKTLTAFLSKSEETWKTAIKEANASSISKNKANKKQMANLNSVIKCLEKHKLDPLKVLPEWKISKKKLSLEKEISDLDKKKETKSELKRAADGIKSSKKETKRQRVTDSVQQQQQKQTKVNEYSASQTLPYGSSAGSVLDSITSSLIAGNVGGLLAAWAGPRSGLSAATHGGVQPIVTCPGVKEVDTGAQTANDYARCNGWLDDAATLNNGSVGYNSSYRSSPLVEGTFASIPSQQRSMERFVGLPSQRHPIESSAGLPSQHPSMAGFAGLPSQQRSMGGFAGLPSQQRGGDRSSGANLYHFADVLEGELNKGGH